MPPAMPDQSNLLARLALNSLYPQLLILLVSIGLFCSILLRFFKSLKVPGPGLYAFTSWRLAYEDWKGTRTRTIHQLHQRYGSVVRIGPNEISFNSLSALKTIYGAGSGFERTSFYRMFDVYGKQNLFTFASPKEHGSRKKLLNHAYSKSAILKNSAGTIEEKACQYMVMLERERVQASEIFTSLHYYSLDNITDFLYGKSGATSALSGSVTDRKLLNDVLDPARRKLSWFATHFPRYIKWVMTRTGMAERLVTFLGMLPQKKPTVYTGIRKHALKAWEVFLGSTIDRKSASRSATIIGRLWEYHISQRDDGLGDMEIASEAADHLLAGVDTTADTLMFLIWALSLPENAAFQEKLIEEVSKMPATDLDSRGIPTVDASGKLPYLDVIIKETLRLYAPLPASEPRSLPVNCVIDGYQISANTVVSMSPYSLHRNAEVFPNPLVFNPDRWLGDPTEMTEMKKWFWAFSSGGRMCIGLHLAMAEMTTLTAAVYRTYRTRVKEGTEGTSPGITSRFEIFYDESKPYMKEHECYIDFEKL
ncbi:putative benzoate 4-monooxygenase cytochrome P450 [Halenospora varia]|nr:putative benzoate 4-monooxygenase cytochrome P450 [Halenospora varia]